MIPVIRSSWALFFGIALLMLGSGLQSSLLGLRATAEGFPTAVTGLVMTSYYAGFLAGSTLVPRLVERVGHIRVFAALASLASMAVLAHVVFIEPASWGAMRLVTGFCYAGLYIVSESWLNDRATNETRGKLLAVYTVVMLSGLACGQFLLNVADPESFELFILISLLVSFALIPILLTANPAPAFHAPESVGLRRLYAMSPLGVVGAFATGTVHGAVFGMGAVFAKAVGLSVAEISLFMAAAIFGGVLLQWPIGYLSDIFDRRMVMLIVTFVAAASAFAAAGIWSPYSGQAPVWTLYLFFGLFGGMALPMYSLCRAHTNDFLEPSQMVAASSSLVFVTGIGAIFGPVTVSALMSAVGPMGYFWGLGMVSGGVGVFAVFRMTRRRTRPPEEREAFVAMPAPASPMAAVLISEGEGEDRPKQDPEPGSAAGKSG
jgi:MFS family permease